MPSTRFASQKAVAHVSVVGTVTEDMGVACESKSTVKKYGDLFHGSSFQVSGSR
jgi:hypothetical protein